MFQEFTVELPRINTKEFNIEDFGGVSGGQKSNTAAFAAAIAEAAKDGGKVIVPDGIWLTGPIELKSGVELHLEDNAIILFDKSKEEYPLTTIDYEGGKRIRATSPIYADNAEDIAITGKGTIDGNGHLWRPVKSFKMTDKQWKELLEKSQYLIPNGKEGQIWVPTKSIFDGHARGEILPDHEGALEEAAEYYDYYRPVMVNLRHCKRVLLEDVTFQNSPAWCLHPYFCKHLTIKGVRVNNPYHAQNGDALDVESCENVEIYNCYFNAGDDGICIKSGKNKEARKIYGPCQNVYVHNCKVGNGHGGFVIGSEMSRGVKNILVEDCTFMNTDVGIRFKSAMGRGGVVEDIHIRRLQMLNIKGEAAIFTMNYVLTNMNQKEGPLQSEDPEDIPVFKNIYVEDCFCKGAKTGIKIQGMDGKPEAIHDIYFSNCVFEADGEDILENCMNIEIK